MYTELKTEITQEDNKTSNDINTDFNYNELVLLKTLSTNLRARIEQYVKSGKMQKIHTPKGVAVNKSELKFIIEHPTPRGKVPQVQGYSINLTEASRHNCIYKRLADMNRPNKALCQKDNRLPRYIDDFGYACINLYDYLAPQIKQISHKLECREYLIRKAIYQVLHDVNNEVIGGAEDYEQ